MISPIDQMNLSPNLYLRKVINNDTFADVAYNISHQLLHNYDSLVADILSINKSFVDKAVVCTVESPGVRDFVNSVDDLNSFLDVRQPAISPLRLILAGCATTDVLSSGACPFGTALSSDPLAYSNYNDCDVSNKTYLYYHMSSLNASKSSADRYLPQLRDMKDTYKAKVDYVFGNSSVDYAVHPDYLACLTLLDDASKIWWTRLDRYSNEYSSQFLDCTDWNRKLDLLDDIELFYNLTQGEDSLLKADRFDVCNYFVRKDWFDVISDKAYGLFLAHVDATQMAYLDSSNLLDELGNQAATLLSEVQTRSDLFLEPFRRFLRSNETKMNLFRHVNSAETMLVMETQRLANDRFITDWQQFFNKLTDAQNNLESIYENAFNLSIPSLTDGVIDGLWIVAYARQHQVGRLWLQSSIDVIIYTSIIIHQGISPKIVPFGPKFYHFN